MLSSCFESSGLLLPRKGTANLSIIYRYEPHNAVALWGSLLLVGAIPEGVRLTRRLLHRLRRDWHSHRSMQH